MQFGHLKRREFITLLSGAAVWPMAARAQQSAMPVIGYLSFGAATALGPRVAAFKHGLSEAGYVEDQNVAIEYRFFAQIDHLPVLAADLVRRKPAAIFANGPVSIRVLKGQTATIPIVFSMGEDPVKEGLVASLNRPGGNITGFRLLCEPVVSKTATAAARNRAAAGAARLARQPRQS